MKILAATGHRPHKLNNEYNYDGPVSKWLREEIKSVLVSRQPDEAISGMAIGVDTLFALCCLELKIPLIAAVPFYGQEQRWPQSSKDIFYSILDNPLTKTHIVCEGEYAGWKFIRRDHWMVNNSTELLAVYNGDQSGGTYQTYKYAVDKGHPIIRINPYDCPFFRSNV